MGAVPDRLYKYQSRTAGRAVLESRTLRWSTPATLNDPFDIQFDLGMHVDSAKVRQLALEKLWRVYKGELVPSPRNPMGIAISMLMLGAPGMTSDELWSELGPGIQEGLNNGEKLIPQTLAESRAIMDPVPYRYVRQRFDVVSLCRISQRPSLNFFTQP